MPREFKLGFRISRELGKLPASVKLLSIVVFVYYLGWGISYPFLPIYFRQILGSYSAVGFVVGLPFLLSVAWSILVGSLLDRVSRRGLLSISLLLYLPLSPWLLKLRNLFDFVVFRLYHSVVRSCLWTSVRAYLRAHSPRGRTSEAFGLCDACYSLSLVVGPLLGGALLERVGFLAFLSISLFAFLAFFLSLFLKGKRSRWKVFRLGSVVKVKELFAKAFHDIRELESCNTLLPLTFFTYFSASFLGMVLSLLLKELGTSFFVIGLISSAFYLPGVFEMYFSVLADKVGKRLTMVKGFSFVTLFFFLLFFFSSGPFEIFLLSFFLSLSFSAVIPSLEGRLTEIMPRREVGEATGVFEAARSLAYGTGPWVAGIVSDAFGLKYSFLLGGFVSLFMLLLLLSREV